MSRDHLFTALLCFLALSLAGVTLFYGYSLSDSQKELVMLRIENDRLATSILLGHEKRLKALETQQNGERL